MTEKPTISGVYTMRERGAGPGTSELSFGGSSSRASFLVLSLATPLHSPRQVPNDGQIARDQRTATEDG